MEHNLIIKVLNVGGMTCPGCELRIENVLKKTTGVLTVDAKYIEGNVNLTFDSSIVDLPSIIKAIESMDYRVKSIGDTNIKLYNNERVTKKRGEIAIAFGAVILIILIIFLLRNTVGLDLNVSSVTPGMGYGILFIIGLITSLHCIAMCGGINLSLCASYKSRGSNKFSELKPSILYNAGRVISYTIIGGIVGSIGHVVNISPGARGVGAMIAGSFMILMGINMLNLFPVLRKSMPKMPKILGNKIYSKIGKSSPLVVGLLNGLMPCGPLQSMQIYALGTGSFISGALSMIFFSVGTVPLMFGLGAISSMLSERFTNKMMKVGAILVAALGLMMLVMGFSRR